MNSNVVYEAAVLIIPLVVAIVFHEVAHGWVAKWLGDPTAADLHRLSFNPLRHVDPVGTIVLPLMLAIAHAPVFGWAKPVPVVSERLRNPRTGMMLVALAGPGMNLALALVAAVVLGVISSGGALPTVGVAGFVADVVFQFLIINVFLALFNLLPIPPFDGGHVVQGLLPQPLALQWAKLARFGFILLIGLLVVLPMVAPNANVVARLVVPPAQAVTRFFLGIAGLFA